MPVEQQTVQMPQESNVPDGHPCKDEDLHICPMA